MIKFTLCDYDGFSCFFKDLVSWLLPQCKTLRPIFTLRSITPERFSKSVIKKLQRAKKDGTQIIVRKGNGYCIAIKVINEEDRRNTKIKIANAKRAATNILKKPEFKKYMGILIKAGYSISCRRVN